jgi:hypothetical protein
MIRPEVFPREMAKVATVAKTQAPPDLKAYIKLRRDIEELICRCATLAILPPRKGKVLHTELLIENACS